MSLKIRCLVCAGLIAPFILISCASTGTGTSSAVSGSPKTRAAALIAEAEAAREAAVASGVEEILPDRLGAVDETLAAARAKNDAKDYKGAIPGATEARDRYLALGAIADAYAMKKEADEHDFITYDPDNYQAASDAGNNAVDAFDAGDLAAAQELAAASQAAFGLVLENGWVAYTNEKSAAAQGWRQAAIDVKANVAVREVFQTADEAYNEAFIALRAGDLKIAAGLFDQSGARFKESRDSAVEKRTKAEESIRDAERKAAQSDTKAKSAQETLGEKE